MEHLNSPSQQSSKKLYFSSSAFKLSLLLIVCFSFLLLSSTFVSASREKLDLGDDPALYDKNNGSINMDDYEIAYRNQFTDYYYNKTNHSNMLAKITEMISNIPDEHGIYQDYNNITKFYYDENYGGLILTWANKVVKLKPYITDLDNNRIFIDKDIITQTDFNTEIIKNDLSFYYNHTFNKEAIKNITSFSYDLEFENVTCRLRNYSLLCDEQSIDFSQAVYQQNLDVDLKLESFHDNIFLRFLYFFKINKENSISISGDDLSYIDPITSPNIYLLRSGEVRYRVLEDNYNYNSNPYDLDVGFEDTNDGEEWRGYNMFSTTSIPTSATITAVVYTANIIEIVDSDCSCDATTTLHRQSDHSVDYTPNDEAEEEAFEGQHLPDIFSQLVLELVSIHPEAKEVHEEGIACKLFEGERFSGMNR
jgi:hypothetical protein